MSEYPEPNELVVCRIKNIKGYGAFVDLLEYPKEGFIHISQIASGWIKNIRSHVSEGQIRVALVTNVDREKGMIDVSLRKVNDNQEKRRMSQYKRAKRADKLFERAANELKEDPKESYKKVAEPLKEEFGDLYTGFEAISASGAEAIKQLKLPKKWVDHLVKLAEENVTAPEVTITRKLTLMSYEPDGVKTLRSALQTLEKEGISVTYLSAPGYTLSVTAGDYPDAEKVLRNGLEKIEKQFKKHGEMSVERAQK
ncbi:MAG: translation initiation factor IF-2 subunit alpha [Candidatus Diapherotrites archaeon]|nr:translation initiation factor IF-2 subunit alpha [Candidatus Diapherotrites archaeon]